MRDGRGIQDEEWIKCSVEHNNNLTQHDSIEKIRYDKYDITGKTVVEVANYVDLWINEKLI